LLSYCLSLRILILLKNYSKLVHVLSGAISSVNRLERIAFGYRPASIFSRQYLIFSFMDLLSQMPSQPISKKEFMLVKLYVLMSGSAMICYWFSGNCFSYLNRKSPRAREMFIYPLILPWVTYPPALSIRALSEARVGLWSSLSSINPYFLDESWSTALQSPKLAT